MAIEYVSRNEGASVCQGGCRVSHFLSSLFILPLRVEPIDPGFLIE